MIEITHVETFGFKAAIRGMRNPYESHEKSDSGYVSRWNVNAQRGTELEYEYGIGPADMTLAKKLIKAGPEHRKFLRMIHVQCDVLAPPLLVG